MAMSGTYVTDVPLKGSAEKNYKRWKNEPNFVDDVVGHHMEGLAIQEGDWDPLGAILLWYYIIGNINESSTNDEQIISTGQSRWNPTREQMMALEEVYRSGTRTPTTQQIQEIASKLQKYGRIEGKNVFYWFQNHKSRERLKRRRPDHQEQRLATNNIHEESLRKDDTLVDSSVLRRRGDHRVIHTKSFLSSSPTHPQNNDGKMEEYEKGMMEEKEATWQNQINSINSDYQMVITSKGSKEAEQQDHNLNEEEEEETRKSRTLDLFPVTENQDKTNVTGFEEKDTKPNGQMCCNYYYYYEFMPLMN